MAKVKTLDLCDLALTMIFPSQLGLNQDLPMRSPHLEILVNKNLEHEPILVPC